MKASLLFLLFVISCNGLSAQVGIGTATPQSSSILDIQDSARGLLIPRMTMANRNSIQTPATGLMVFQTDSIKGFWYFDGTDWKNINASASNGGKHTLILSDTITNEQAQAKILAEFGPNTQELRIQSCSYLTTIDLSMLTTLANVTITDNPLLQSVNLSNLKICDGYFSLNNCPSLTNVNVNSLEKIIYYVGTSIASLYISGTKLNVVNFPRLKRVTGSLVIANNGFLTTVSFPALSNEISNLSIQNNPDVINIQFPLLQQVGVVLIMLNPSLTTIALPSLTALTSADAESYIMNPNLTSLTFGSLTSFNNMSINCQGKLPSPVINALLNNFKSITPSITGKTMYMPQVPAAPPTGQGIADKAILVANGNTVVTD